MEKSQVTAKESAQVTLTQAEADFKDGKISEADYQQVKQCLEDLIKDCDSGSLSLH